MRADPLLALTAPKPSSMPDRREGVVRRRRVLLVFGSLERAGAQLRMLEICRELAATSPVEFDVCLLGLGPNELGEEAASVAASIQTVPIRSPRSVARLRRLFAQGRYDVVAAFPLFYSGIVLALAARAGIPARIAHVRNSRGHPTQTGRASIGRRLLETRWFPWIMRTLIVRNATHVTAVSQSALDSVYPGRWQDDRTTWSVIYNGVRPSAFEKDPDRDGVRSEFGWPADSRIVIDVARLSRQKNHRAVLEATKLARASDERIRLLLVGSGSMEAEIRAWIEELSLGHACAITAGRSDVPRLLLASDVFLFPSLWEGLPGGPLEALAAGLPVVTSDIGPLREIAPSFPGAIFMASADDAAAHAEHILHALEAARDRDEARRRFAESPFSFTRAVSSYRTLYGIG